MKKFTPEKLKKILFESIDQLLEYREKYLSNPRTDFSRTQKISFRDTMLFPIVTSGENTSVEILDFFPETKIPSQSAMSYRRSQINEIAFKDCFLSFTKKLPRPNTLHDMHLIACDGTRVNTPYNPADQNSFVNCIEGRKGFNQYHLVTCYDVLNELYTDAVIQSYHSMNENRAFCTMMDRYPKEDKENLFIADRGFSSYSVIAHAENTGNHFLIRTTSTMAQSIFRDTNSSFEADTFDITDDFYLGRVRTKETSALNNYHFIHKTQRCDYIPLESRDIERFRVRLVKFELPGGQPEYLITDLPQSSFSLSDLREIYNRRWGIETSFRFLKYASGMVHVHSLKPEFIYQEIFAKLTLFNFCSSINEMVKKEEFAGSKNKYVIERTYLIKYCKRFLKGKLKKLLETIKKRKVPVRAGRNFERNVRRQHADTVNYR